VTKHDCRGKHVSVKKGGGDLRQRQYWWQSRTRKTGGDRGSLLVVGARRSRRRLDAQTNLGAARGIHKGERDSENKPWKEKQVL